jgi:threonine synthase
VKYVSTRGSAPVLPFGDVLLAGLATDGGLYLPETWPPLDPEAQRRLAHVGYAEAATEVMYPFVEGALERDEFGALVAASYETFDDPAVVPLRELGAGLWLLELFHGPTLAFKDVALQLVGRLFDHELARRGEKVTIVGATSGDTGSAAIEACRDRGGIEIFILHPAGRVSEIQRRQMTTVGSSNVHNIAIEGTFDDCQDLVKALFADERFRTDVRMSAVNSINWARVMAQIVYYVTAASELGSPQAPVGFSVPTGNFGNIFAGWSARRMGAPISQLIVGSNRNDILTRFFTTGTMELGEVHPTLSPSMDIQVSSNLERLLFELYGRDGTTISELMQEFRSEGRVEVDPDRLRGVHELFDAARVDDAETLAEIRTTFEQSGLLLDPHTAVGVAAARRVRRDESHPMVCLATAHPAKFPDAIEQATGVRPALPARLSDLLDRPEYVTPLPNDFHTVRTYISETTTV